METKNPNIIPPSELIINEDGSVFHLHIKPEQLTDRIIVCGDPARVNMIADHFDRQTFETFSREFHCIGGEYKGKPVMCLSHGIGPDNIDIVLNELDALANVDFKTREIKDHLRQLTIVRIGTSGALQPELKIGTPVIAEIAVGFDGVLNYYEGRDMVSEKGIEEEFIRQTDWNDYWARPYFVRADESLVEQIGRTDMVRGTTISAVGFYGPQGRKLRLPLSRPGLNASIEAFRYDGRRITNYEMESAPLQGLSRLMGHRAMTVCSIIANRFNLEATSNYRTAMSDLIETVLERL